VNGRHPECVRQVSGKRTGRGGSWMEVTGRGARGWGGVGPTPWAPRQARFSADENGGRTKTVETIVKSL